jgi:hypothetical protein
MAPCRGHHPGRGFLVLAAATFRSIHCSRRVLLDSCPSTRRLRPFSHKGKAPTAAGALRPTSPFFVSRKTSLFRHPQRSRRMGGRGRVAEWHS